MSTPTDWSYLPLLLDGPLYILPEPANAPVVPPIVAAPMAPAVLPTAAVPQTQPLPAAPPVAAAPQETVPPVAAPPKAVAPPVPKIPVSAPQPAPRRRLRVMVLYNEQTTPYLQPAHETLLVNILKAVGLTLEDIELVNLNNIRRVDYAEILREKTLHQFISFGIDLRELQLNIPLTAYKVQKVEDIQMLLADSFHELQLNTDKKRLLWTCLKQMFLKTV
jgi:DNA polymerase III psi subunit